MNAKELIYLMLIENTGTNFLDSGGTNGRNWQRNQGKTLEYFENSPAAYLEVYKYSSGEYDLIPTVSLYHHLKHCLELDEVCNKFNSIPVNNWDSEEFWGVSSEGQEYLNSLEYSCKGDGFNTCNWNAIFSQVIQGNIIEIDSELYALIQIHGGCDIRGGYTDAKLFKLNYGEYCLFNDDCSFSVETKEGELLTLDYYGELAHEGTIPEESYLKKFGEIAGVGIIEGEYFGYY